jgi:hypothetical protein
VSEEYKISSFGKIKKILNLPMTASMHGTEHSFFKGCWFLCTVFCKLIYGHYKLKTSPSKAVVGI